LDLLLGLAYLWDRAGKLLFTWDSVFSLSSLLCALIVSFLFLMWRRYRRGRRIRLRTILRALFPRHVVRSQSNVADIGYMLFYVFAFAAVLGWAVLSYQFLTNAIIDALVALFGRPDRSGLPEWVSRSAVTLILFLAYEFGYWINHYLSHRIPFLWEFHKVHHAATVLTPITVFRVHPVYMAIFLNILAITAAVATGAANYMFGNTAYQYAISETNIILVIFIHAWGHLQHSQVWISFTGVVGRILLSPAHHQVHHSANPVHFNKNLGSVLAVWDWAFGTLHVPKKEGEKVSFGVEPDRPDAHTIRGELLAPFSLAFRPIFASLRKVQQPVRAFLLGRKKHAGADGQGEEQLALPLN
jgi:sterol desaturase/sphingolipid hydroxylase (fatty acid hydroxylase superfamily)